MSSPESTAMPRLIRSRLEDARDTALRNIEYLRKENGKAVVKIDALRAEIAHNDAEIADNEAAAAEAKRLLGDGDTT